MRCWLLFPVLHIGLVSSNPGELCGDEQQLLQEFAVHRQGQPDRGPTSLKDLAERLLKAKKECLRSSMECIPALKQVRYRVWPYVQELIHWPHKPWEPNDFHPQVVKAKMNCNGDSNYTMFLLHMWKSAGWASMENLEAVSESWEMVDAFEDNYAWCEKLGFDSTHKERRSTFTFVREPLSRLISGYAEIERTYKGHRYDFLNQAAEGTEQRAKLFMDRYFEDGAIYNGHVKPQSEYFAPFSTECGLPIDFVGKTERIAEDWKTFLESRHCEAAKTPWSNDLGQHPTDGWPKDALSNLLFNGVSLLSTDATTGSAQSTASTAASHIKNVLHNDDHAYLRAFCWLLLSDYVMFEYDLPEKCNDPEMLTVMDLTKSISLR